MILESVWPLEPIWSNALGFIGVMVFATAAMGAISRSMTIASTGGYLMFVILAMEANVPVLTNVMYVTLVIVHLALGFKLWKAEGPA